MSFLDGFSFWMGKMVAEFVWWFIVLFFVLIIGSIAVFFMDRRN